MVSVEISGDRTTAARVVPVLPGYSTRPARRSSCIAALRSRRYRTVLARNRHHVQRSPSRKAWWPITVVAHDLTVDNMSVWWGTGVSLCNLVNSVG
jgi:hypothetical protein